MNEVFMSIITQVKGTYLEINDQSAVDVVGETLAKLGLQSNVSIRQRHFRKKDQTGLKLRADFTVGLDIPGPRGDNMKARISLTNASLPGQAFALRLGALRLICTNGLYGFGDIFERRINHRPGQTAIDLLESIPAAIETVHGEDHEIANQAKALDALPVLDPAYVVQALELPTKTEAAVLSMISRGTYRPEDAPSSAWGLYNLVNEVDRLLARRGSFAFQSRDEGMLTKIVSLAGQQKAA
jgi:hypothetical protein